MRNVFEVSKFLTRTIVCRRISPLGVHVHELFRETTMSQAIDVSEAVAPVKKARRSWQFSVRGLLILMTLCCAGVAMIACPPILVIAEILALIGLAIFCVTAIFYGRGWISPFALLCGTSLLLFFVTSWNIYLNSPEAAIMFYSIQIFGSVFVGICGAAAHGFLKQRSGVVPIPNVPWLRHWLHNPEETKQ